MTHIHRLSNGIVLLAEEMDSVASAAFSVLVPVGSAVDPEGLEGASTLLNEMLNKGAGPWNSKELSDQFERLGVHRSQGSGIEVSIFSGSMLGENLLPAVKLFGRLLLEPLLPAEELDSVKQLALQELLSLEDEPSNKVMVELARCFYPHPFGRCQLGTKEGIEGAGIDALRAFFQRQFVPEGVIIGVAGKFDWPSLQAAVEGAFGGWRGSKVIPQPGKPAERDSQFHIQRDTSQLQIALAFPSVSFDNPDYYAAKTAVGVLSGGMAGRLFIEVREKRGLVYRVSASHSAARGRAAVFCYAGTTPEKAEETLSVMVTELRKLKDGVTEEELQRAKADLKSRIVMQGELSASRASALVNDWWNIGQVRSLEDIKRAIDAVTDADIRRHLLAFPVSPITLVSLGSKAMELPK